MNYLGNQDWIIEGDTASPHLDRDLQDDFDYVCGVFRENPMSTVAYISDVLSSEGLDSLSTLDIPANGHCETDELLSHPVGKILVSIMGRMSLSNRQYELEPERVSARLKNETGDEVTIAPHRDLLDGHAVLFNWGVEGDLAYRIDGSELPIRDNCMFVLNGSANWQEVTQAVTEETPDGMWRFGGTTAVHSVIGRGHTSRNRLLVYADGQDTEFTQVFVDEYGPVPEMADNLLFVGLRPSLGFYIE